MFDEHLLYTRLCSHLAWTLVPRAGTDMILQKLKTKSSHASSLKSKTKRIFGPTSPSEGFSALENHSISTWVVLIISCLLTAFDVTPVMVLIIALEHPLYGTLLSFMYPLQLDCEFHKEGTLCQGFPYIG